jgi:hypothetical protein
MSKYNNNNEKTGQASSQWGELIVELLDRFMGKDTPITYTFENLIIDIPRAVDQDWGSAKWIINGKVVITSEMREFNELDQNNTISSFA